MELSFLFSSVLSLFIFMAVLGSVTNKTVQEYSTSKYSYFISIFITLSVFTIGIVFLDDILKRRKNKNKNISNNK